MMSSALTRRAHELAALRAAFVTATVVRVAHPTSVEPGSVALVLGDGTIEGFVGGVCAEHSVRVYSLKAMHSGEPLLLRIMPDAPGEGDELREEADGAVTVRNPCLSGGAIEVFLEPILPAPRVLVLGDTPIAAALQSLGSTLGLEIVASHDHPDAVLQPSSGDLALVVAAHGRDEHSALRRGVEARLPYVGLVASARRGAAAIKELRCAGVADELLNAIDTPAGIEIGARTAPEIALSILARIVTVRRRERANATDGTGPLAGPVTAPTGAPATPVEAITAVDPICGMTIVVTADTPVVEHGGEDGESAYFCCSGCKGRFEARHEHAVASS